MLIVAKTMCRQNRLVAYCTRVALNLTQFAVIIPLNNLRSCRSYKTCPPSMISTLHSAYVEHDYQGHFYDKAMYSYLI